eukprot:2757548-Alexandrium_andersonii.AAC.1
MAATVKAALSVQDASVRSVLKTLSARGATFFMSLRSWGSTPSQFEFGGLRGILAPVARYWNFNSVA